MRDNIFFDLDGTLIDPALGITKGVAFALAQLNQPPLGQKTLELFIGPPLYDAFAEYANLPQELHAEAVRHFREYYAEHGRDEQTLFPGIKEMLAALRDAGKKLYIATTKPAPFAKYILDGHGITDFFEDISGSPLTHSGLPKDVIIDNLLQNHKINPDDAVMVGDRKYDIIGAQQTGLHSVGVLFGYGSREELEEAGAPLIAQDVAQLAAMLLQNPA